MRKDSGDSIQVNGGDGIAVGTGNSITGVKHQKTIHQHSTDAIARGQGDAGHAFMMLLGAAFLLAAFAYFFALHADALFWWARGLSYLGVLVLGGGMLLATSRRDEWPQARSWGLLVLVLVMMAAVAATAAHRSFDPELGDLARRARSIHDFWCALSPLERQHVLLHAASMTLGLLPGVLLCLMPICSYGLQEVLGLSIPSETVDSWRLVLLGGVLIVAGACLHTQAGKAAWEAWLKEPAAFSCAGSPLRIASR